MKCPVCPEATLNISERQNIEIDYCPQCRGIWLDRGELDKLLARAEQEALASAPPVAPAAPAPSYERAPVSDDRGRRDDRYGSDYDSRGGRKPYKKKSSFLGEILDF